MNNQTLGTYFENNEESTNGENEPFLGRSGADGEARFDDEGAEHDEDDMAEHDGGSSNGEIHRRLTKREGGLRQTPWVELGCGGDGRTRCGSLDQWRSQKRKLKTEVTKRHDSRRPLRRGFTTAAVLSRGNATEKTLAQIRNTDGWRGLRQAADLI